MAKDVDPALGRFAVTYENLGIDSNHDYDAVWQKCRELGMAPTFHAGGRGFGLRNSPSNFTFNHIGHFAAAGHSIAKGLFLGGVTRRFPDLNFAFLEGGVGWGCQLFADLIEHWERRGAKGIAYMDPKKLDRALLKSLVEKYGYDDMAAELQRRDGWPSAEEDNLTGGVPVLDDFAACKIARKEDWVDLYARPYYFGCEADDRMNVTAFGRANPFGARINAIFSSDIGHFDVPDMLSPVPEAHELVEDELITAGRFPRLHLRQCRAPVGSAEPAFLRGHEGGEGGGGGAERRAGARRRGIAVSSSPRSGEVAAGRRVMGPIRPVLMTPPPATRAPPLVRRGEATRSALRPVLQQDLAVLLEPGLRRPRSGPRTASAPAPRSAGRD